MLAGIYKQKRKIATINLCSFLFFFTTPLCLPVGDRRHRKAGEWNRSADTRPRAIALPRHRGEDRPTAARNATSRRCAPGTSLPAPRRRSGRVAGESAGAATGGTKQETTGQHRTGQDRTGRDGRRPATAVTQSVTDNTRTSPAPAVSTAARAPTALEHLHQLYLRPRPATPAAAAAAAAAAAER